MKPTQVSCIGADGGSGRGSGQGRGERSQAGKETRRWCQEAFWEEEAQQGQGIQDQRGAAVSAEPVPAGFTRQRERARATEKLPKMLLNEGTPG